MYIGYKIPKNTDGSYDIDTYVKIADWCNETHEATITDRGEYYECVAAPAPTFEELKERKKAEIAAARYDYEVAGVIYQNVHVTTDREDQAMITAIALSAVVDPTYTTVWKGTDGYLSLNAASILVLARMVGAHVEVAFAIEKRLVDLIDKAQSQADLDAVIWQDPD